MLIHAAKSQKEVARLAEVSDGTFINWQRGLGVRESKLRQVARNLGVSLEWLRDGVGDEKAELAAFRAKLRGPDHPLISRHKGLEATYEAWADVVLPDGTTGRYVPLLSCAQAARWDAGHAHAIGDYPAIFALHADDRPAFAIKVLGNSMEPAFREGDMVICSPSQQIHNGEAAVVRTRREQVFINYWHKRGERILLESANADYKPLDFPSAEIAGAWPVVQTITAGKVRRQSEK